MAKKNAGSGAPNEAPDPSQDTAGADAGLAPTGFNRKAVTISYKGKMRDITNDDLIADPELLEWLKEKRPNLFI